MQSTDQREYYRRREIEERAAAEVASDIASGIHLVLAERYSLLAAGAASELGSGLEV